ncbi:SDR family NAD(P)-dependent oxidoreductase [Calothrix sp. 336/3]|uniref:SDR family NAD(P)-dependent oxidoreductase n=1 Tax=Calothrix sp. 336/3 TaxID=1337936 RepID=UPI0004E3687E|nr:SDR family oxidoreductase [Calothrix sp. 336/3]AKG20969.1 oxidoreductase [Calothrix sp. 336/3]
METALITGASSGIGEAFAEELAARQMNLVLVARSAEKLQQLAQTLQAKYGVRVDVIPLDLTTANAASVIFDTTQSLGITIDLLINNAGFGDYGEFSSRQGDRQVQMIQLNVLALVDLTHKYLPLMRDRRGGSIINVASIAAFQPLPYMSVYAASKAFVRSFSEALWAENRQYGIKVLASCPGPTETNFAQEARFPAAMTGKTQKVSTSEEVVKETLAALAANESTVVIGGAISQLITRIGAFVPRKVFLQSLEKTFRF